MNTRLSQLWTDRPWRRRKQEKKQRTSTESPAEDSAPVVNGLTATIERNVRRLSRRWRNDTSDDLPQRRHSTKHSNTRRSFFRSNDEPVLVEDGTAEENNAPPLQRDTLLKKIRRQSQRLSLPRPRTSTGIPKRDNFFDEPTTDIEDEPVPDLPTLVDLQGQIRPRHVPIKLGLEEYDKEQPPPVTGVAITSNDVQRTDHAFVEKPRHRPISSPNSFSQLRVRNGRPAFHSTQPVDDSESSDDDVLTALPSLDFKEFGEIRTPETYSPVQVDRLQRVTPKVVDIVAPRPLSMFSPPSRKESSVRERHKSMIQPVTSAIGSLEDGPKGDWARTRHSWGGLQEGDSEQLEWDKLKQFMEAYGNGRDGGIITVRPVDTDSSESSGSTRNSHGVRYSNAQALAALEFGLT